LFFLSQIIASIAVVASLIFVGREVRENTTALQRNEHNSTMEQWTVVRQAIATNRDIAELMTTGLSGERDLDPADQLRLEQMLQEMAWASFHIWDRTRRGVFPKGTFEQTGGALLCSVINTARGREWWQSSKSVGFYPGFVADVDALLAKA
jgi:predicted acylesterase/phospholipase RssA